MPRKESRTQSMPTHTSAYSPVDHGQEAVCSVAHRTPGISPWRFRILILRLDCCVSPQHPKSSFEECFPSQVKYIAVPSRAIVFKGRSVAHRELGSTPKTGYPKDSGATEFSSKEEAIAHIIAEVSYTASKARDLEIAGSRDHTTIRFRAAAGGSFWPVCLIDALLPTFCPHPLPHPLFYQDV